MAAWVIGNWKLNPVTLQHALSLAQDIAERASSLSQCHLLIAPSTLHSMMVARQLKSTQIGIAAQDVSALTAQSGAYTGDISAAQLQDMGATWVILGHSERREYYAESHDILMQKLQHCQQYGLGVIFCIGETQEAYESGQTEDVLSKQLTVIEQYLNTQVGNTSDLIKNLLSHLIIAYEPVWAIGTGKVPSVEEVTQVHAHIRHVLKNINSALQTLPILYGGSVKPDNAQAFASSSEIDGVLVGGAALNAQSFIAIAQAFATSKP